MNATTAVSSKTNVTSINSDELYSFDIKNFKDVFNKIDGTPSQMEESQLRVKVWKFPMPSIPKINSGHCFDSLSLMVTLNYLRSGRGQIPYFFGPQGCGKSTTAEQICARIGLELIEITVGANTEVIELGGQLLPTTKGGMRFFDGALIQAMREGKVLLINEYDLMQTTEQKALNTVMEQKKFTIIQTGETVTAHPDFRIIITANTNNTGGSGGFASSGIGDNSVNDRFIFLTMDYLSKETETQVLKDSIIDLLNDIRLDPEVSKEMTLGEQVKSLEPMITCMIDVATSIRESYKSGLENAVNAMSDSTLSCALSTRSLISWLEQVLMFKYYYGFNSSTVIIDSFTLAFANGISSSDKPVVIKVLKDKFNI